MISYKEFLEEEMVNALSKIYFKIKVNTNNIKYSNSTIPEKDKEGIINQTLKFPEPFRTIRFLAKSDGTVYLFGMGETHRDLAKISRLSDDIKKEFKTNNIFPGKLFTDWSFDGDMSPENIDTEYFRKNYKNEPDRFAQDIFDKWKWINSFAKDFLINSNGKWRGNFYQQFIEDYLKLG